jgi:hypothetical protein
VVIELLDFDRLAVHHDVQKTVDMILRGIPPRPEIRVRTGAGDVEVVQDEQTAELKDPGYNQRYPALHRAEKEPQRIPNGAPGRSHGALREEPAVEGANMVRIFPYGIARTRLERAIREKRAPAYVTNDIHQADAIMAIRSTYQNKPRKLREMAGRPVPTVVVKSNTFSQISGALEDILRQANETPQIETKAMEEVQNGIEIVLQSGKPFELSPAPAPVRKVQHQMAEARRLASESVGEEPHRRLRILPTKVA